MLAIETHNLTKTYQGQGGCQGISLAVPRATVFGLLGPNGAGKSTLVKMLVGLLQPTSGEAKVLGKPIQDAASRQKVGFLPENFRYHDWLSGEDLLRFHASLFGLSASESAGRIAEVLNMVGLSEHRHKRVGNYSKGMQQRIGLGCALLPDPELIFLDEPTSALDPIGRKVVRDLIVSLQEQGKTVFINSHLLSELENICNHIAIIKQGNLLFQGNWRELTNRQVQVKIILDVLGNENRLADAVPTEYQVISQTPIIKNTRYELLISCPSEEDIPGLIHSLTAANYPIFEVTPVTDSLEKIFLDYVSNRGWEGR
ncbi:ABC transporter ATP-binding protein [Desulforamulus aeronauticus]|uniref:ABC-2 type transport system ATP-binding protein n=1 Tax=Desulforamulus aeronauticus DSM 10349 TaxID=1121421 RepID=A0A1M6P5I1_9FIRM|nr:ABC transporter ATP-binding protein [Desulforamulus aeronauticus]SHK03136.1 ABC-2 type transport system ATP-binding protein [Desulforamulus aeronauticus DSM 10349]